MLKREALDGTMRDPQASPHRTIGLRQDERDVVTGAPESR
jgi:hypothetical protein